MALDLSHRHATGVQRQDLVIEARPAGLVLGDDLRLETAVAVTGHFNRHLTELAFERLLALAVAGVAGGIGYRLVAGVAKVFGHLRVQRSLDQFLGELLEHAMLADQVFRFLVIGQQAVDQFVAYGHFYSLQSDGSFLPNDRLHKNSYTLPTRDSLTDTILVFNTPAGS